MAKDKYGSNRQTDKESPGCSEKDRLVQMVAQLCDQIVASEFGSGNSFLGLCESSKGVHL